MAKPRQPKSRLARQPNRRIGRPGGASRAFATPADQILLYGLHPVEAALANPSRPVSRLLATPNAAQRLGPAVAARGLACETVSPKQLDRLLGPETVHQGVALEVGPLPPHSISELPGKGVVLVLDQITDPHNVGALLRSAAAFGAEALIMQQRHSPPLGGTLAKAASGALDVVPVILAGNLAAALQDLKQRGFWLIGLAEEADSDLENATPQPPLALLLGAEGRGLRRLTRDHCDQLCRISTATALASLNVSNAGAIALHWAHMPSGPARQEK
jgi:23S rRNA (guanosine2251-2'-O)-methyltransferase